MSSKGIAQQMAMTAVRTVVIGNFKWIGIAVAAIVVPLLFIGMIAGALNPFQNSGLPFTSVVYGPLDRAKIDAVLSHSGVFAGKTDMFIQAAQRHNIDPVLLMAIALHETGNGTSPACTQKNNPGGIMMPPSFSQLRAYPSLDQGIDAMAENLYNLYISQGLVTIPQIGAKYAPVGAANDPTGSNASWVPDVTAIATQLGGLTVNYLGGNGSWVCPVPKPITISSNYGTRSDPFTGSTTFHSGIDLPKTTGTPVFAACSGKVVEASDGRGYGLHVVILHNGNLYSVYGHMNSLSVSTGATVTAGQQIGTVGSTGRSTGPHLHFEIDQGAMFQNSTDPKSYIGL